MKQEAQQKLRLVSSLVRQDTAAKSRLERTSSEKLKHTVELARQREEQIAKAAEAKVIREQRVREQIAAAAAIKEKERNERARRAMESKESQRLYYVQRNAMKDARFEQMGQEYFEAAMQSEGGLRPQTASAALESGDQAAAGDASRAPPPTCPRLRSPWAPCGRRRHRASSGALRCGWEASRRPAWGRRPRWLRQALRRLELRELRRDAQEP